MDPKSKYPKEPVLIHSGLDGKYYETFVFPSSPVAFRDVEAAVLFLSCVMQEPKEHMKQYMLNN